MAMRSVGMREVAMRNVGMRDVPVNGNMAMPQLTTLHVIMRRANLGCLRSILS
jgi:hypothetical protein